MGSLKSPFPAIFLSLKLLSSASASRPCHLVCGSTPGCLFKMQTKGPPAESKPSSNKTYQGVLLNLQKAPSKGFAEAVTQVKLGLLEACPCLKVLLGR